MKKAFAVIVVFLAVVFAFGVKADATDVVASGNCGASGSNLTWTLDSDGVLTISGTGAMKDYTYTTEVPWNNYRDSITGIIMEEGCTTIGDNAFYYCRFLTGITIPEGVTSIGHHAFYTCDRLTSIAFPDSLTSIKKYAFHNCESLTSITIPDGVVSIAEYAFYNCSGLTSVKLPNHIAFIKESVFADCGSLSEIVIPNSVTSIGVQAFNNCNALTSVTIGCGVSSIGNGAFNLCSGITDVYYIGTRSEWNSVLIDTGNTYLQNASKHYLSVTDSGTCGGEGDGTNLTWTFYEDGTLKISGTGAMADYTSASPAPWNSYREQVLSVAIKSGITRIGNLAFLRCGYLTSVAVPDSIVSIGASAFYSCNYLTSMFIPDGVTSIENSTFHECVYMASITIPDSITSIGSGAFRGCYSLTSIHIPDGINIINDYTFSGCSGLTSIKIPDAVTSIGQNAFAYCRGLTSIEIPDKVKSIGGYAFKECSGLTSITIPDRVTTIGIRLFEGCSSLISITIPDGITAIYDAAFLNCSSLTSITIPDGVTIIYYSTFCGCSSLTSITLPEGVTEIECYAFQKCSNLTSINIPDSVTSIEYYAFDRCTSLTSITIPDSITFLDDNLFNGCSSLTSITIPASVTTIEDAAFFGCGALSDVYFIGTRDQWNAVTIGSGNESLLAATIHYVLASGYCGGEGDGTNLVWMLYDDGTLKITGTGAMKNYSAASNVPWYSYIDSIIKAEMEEGCTTISDNAFFGYGALLSVSMPDSLTKIGERSFYQCTVLPEITIPENVTNIGTSAFYGCVKLEKVYYNATAVSSVNSYAFGNVGTLVSGTDVIIGSNVELIPNYMFAVSSSQTSNIKSVTIGGNVASIGNYAFQNCTELTEITIPESVTSIGSNVFYGCSNLAEVKYNGTHCQWETVQGYGNVQDILMVYLLGEHSWGGIQYSWSDDKTQATASHICNLCDHEESETVNAELTVTTPGTCTESGFGIRTATFTMQGAVPQTVDVVIAALGHNAAAAVEEGRVEPTCTAAGHYDSVVYCSVCEAELSRETVTLAALGHDYIHHAAQAAGCTTIGWNAYDTCSRCDYTTYAEIAALGHDYIHHAAQAAGCTTIGWDAYDTCSRCDYTTYAEIPALGHNADAAVEEGRVEPTCTAAGHYDSVVYCSVCEAELSRETVTLAALGHDYIHHAAQAATCTEIGWDAYDTCSRCDYTTYAEIPALGHNAAAAVEEGRVEPTCTSAGHYDSVVYCSVCEAELSRETVTLAALGHDYIHHTAKAATCTEIGWDAYDTCSRCDYTTYAEIPALGHIPGEPEIENETEPTATQPGGYDTAVYCTRCGAELERTHHVLPPLSNYVTITNCKLELAGKISIRLYFRAPENAKTAKIFYEDVKTHGYPETASVTLELTRTGNPNYSAAQDLFIMTFPKITSREMTRNIKFVVYDENDQPMWIYYSQGDTYFEDGFEYCAADWASRILAKVDSTDAAKFMAKALLNYGGCAQVYLNNYNPDHPANPNNYLADEMAALQPDPANDMEVPDAAYDIGFQNAKLALEADTTIRLYFDQPVRVWVDGVEKRVYESGGTYLVMIEGISSRNISKKYQITVTNKATGASADILYSVLSWANKQIADGNANATPTAKALYLYNQAAKAYIK